MIGNQYLLVPAETFKNSGQIVNDASHAQRKEPEAQDLIIIATIYKISHPSDGTLVEKVAIQLSRRRKAEPKPEANADVLLIAEPHSPPR